MNRILWTSFSVVAGVLSLDNGVGKLPALGYDTFNAFGCDYNASLVVAQVEMMQKVGLVEAGYNTLILDDCYALKERNATGHMVADPTKFPHGIEALSSQVNQCGVQLAAYVDNGYQTCAGYPGSYGRELQDLRTWHSWGMSYLKYDNCYIPADNITQENIFGRFQRMSDAIADFAEETNKTFQYGLCEWGWQQPVIWGRRIAQSWRNNGDIKPYWSALTAIVNEASFLWWASDFYGHNDMDMLEVGNDGIGTPPGNLTYEEEKSHFTAWALLKSPLFIGTDLT
ncbi:hypothetical protein KC331_g4194, partial [Hortaea werneckii]